MNRLVESPVFLIASVRSGSTLLRCILDSHSRIRAPHELHLGDLRVESTGPYVQLALTATGLDRDEVEHLLWDRLLHRELVVSGKDIVVDKTPGNAHRWRRVARCWPAARYIFLLRHPTAILDSAVATRRSERSITDITEMVLGFLDAVTEARSSLTGLTVRYEDLVTKPQETIERVCGHLDVPFERQMLDYGRWDHGPYRPGIGDFGEKIRAGQVLPDTTPAGRRIPPFLRSTAAAWGYPNADGP